MPVALEVGGAAGKGKLDKKLVEVEEDIREFYLNSKNSWRDTITTSASSFSEYYQK
jgi:hypothetical protein